MVCRNFWNVSSSVKRDSNASRCCWYDSSPSAATIWSTSSISSSDTVRSARMTVFTRPTRAVFSSSFRSSSSIAAQSPPAGGRSSVLAAVAQAGRHAVDGQVDGAAKLAGIAPRGAQAAQQVHLQVVHGVDVRDAIAQAAGQRGVALQQLLRARDQEERLPRLVVLALDAGEDALEQLAIGHQPGVAVG